MGAKSVRPERWSEIEAPSQARLVLVPYGTNLTPDASLVAAPQSLFRERRAPARLTVAVLSGSAGFVDAVGFMMLVGLFPAHVTGELVGLTTALTGGHAVSHASRLLVIPIFIVALVTAALVARRLRQLGESPRSALLGLMTAALAAAALTGCLDCAAPGLGPEWILALRECSVISAMAFQNAFTREGPASSCPTTVMTGNLTHFVFELVEAAALRLRPPAAAETLARVVPKSRLRLVATALVSFAFGALLGGYLVGLTGAFAFVLPALATFALWRRVAREG